MKQAFFTLAFLSCVGISCATTFAADERPNILFLFTDDQAPWAVGASGYPHARTPHMDRLFREGAYLVNAFITTPVCSPSRAGLMTSRFGSEVGITDWLNPRAEPRHGLDANLPCWPKLLANAGYRTALIGKWHLGLEDRHHPTRFGYEYFMGFRGGGNRPENPELEIAGKTKRVEGLLPDILVDDAIRYLREDDDRPFLMSVHFRAPHAVWLPVADVDWTPFAELDPRLPDPNFPNLDVPRVKRMTREYLASVASVDRNVGRILQELERLELNENTVVIYSSDHGYNMGHNGIWHKGNGHWVVNPLPAGTENIPRGQRPNMYDHSIRVPTAVRWPGVIAAETVVTETVSNLDWFPTILAMAGVDLPEGCVIRGRNFLPLLNGKRGEWDNDFYAEYSTQHQSRTHMRMYRTPQWKLIRDFGNPGRDELYDLTNDPAESRNLIADERAAVVSVRERLHQRILSKMQEIDDPLLEAVNANDE